MSNGPVVKDRQQLVMAERRPVPAYSRVVELTISNVGKLQSDYAYSPPLGSRLWLLGVRVWADHGSLVGDGFLNLYLRYGMGVPANAEAVSRWRPLWKVWGKGKWEALALGGASPGRVYTMQMLFEGNALRFGVLVLNSADSQLWVNVAFEISEG